MGNKKAIIDVIIPAFNEEGAIALVINEIPKDLVRDIILVNNGSTDQTAQRAADVGATVLTENKKGYGAACLTGMTHIAAKTKKPDIVVFLDGDHSDYPEQMYTIVQPILDDEVDFVVGSRARGNRKRGSMTIPQIFGNWLSTTILRWLYGVKYTDLGPFRAIRYSSLLQLNMVDTNYGWTVEMQIKASKHRLRYKEVAVDYRQRIGQSKVSGTFKGAISAGYKILKLIFKYA